jgi:trigger factor
MQQRLGKMTEPETISREEDVLNVRFEKCDAQGTPIEGAESKENSLLLKYFRESLRKELSGKKKDDSVTIQ